MSIRLCGGNGLIMWFGFSVLYPFLEPPGDRAEMVPEGSFDIGCDPCSSLQELRKSKETDATVERILDAVKIRIRVMTDVDEISSGKR